MTYAERLRIAQLVSGRSDLDLSIRTEWIAEGLVRDAQRGHTFRSTTSRGWAKFDRETREALGPEELARIGIGPASLEVTDRGPPGGRDPSPEVLRAPTAARARSGLQSSTAPIGDRAAGEPDRDRLAGADASVRRCRWCRGPIPQRTPTGRRTRRDAVFCGRLCKKREARFGAAVGRAERASAPKRIGIADPPYPGHADLYADHPDYAGEVDHAELLLDLWNGYDGWALCTSSDALPALLEHCRRSGIPVVEPRSRAPRVVRIASWRRGSRGAESTLPLSSWEPVLYVPARCDVRRGRVDDSLSFISRPRISDPERVIGAKPSAFCDWLFRLVDARAGDELVDLFPGSRGVGRAWDLFTSGQ